MDVYMYRSECKRREYRKSLVTFALNPETKSDTNILADECDMGDGIP